MGLEQHLGRRRPQQSGGCFKSPIALHRAKRGRHILLVEALCNASFLGPSLDFFMNFGNRAISVPQSRRLESAVLDAIDPVNALSPRRPFSILAYFFSYCRTPMLRRLPPLNALKAFEAAARSESFTRAAEELCVTQGAVSHQVKALEATLGIKLFNRERQRLIITEAGREYLVVVRDALDRIAVGTDRLVQRQTSGVLTVSTSPDFAAKWLVHRLGRFAEIHPDIDLRLSATMHHVDFAREDVDLAVRHGDGRWPGLEVVRLCSERLFPVCSPKLLEGRNRIQQASDLLRFPLLRLDDWSTWKRWFDAAGVNDPVAHGPILNRASMLIDAAIAGHGIALARTALAAWDIINGRLVKPIDISLRLSNTYWIVCPKATARLPKIEIFRKWLLAEAAEDARRLKAS
jgi:LysR family transcriptional regulator, glycine cleavage system transcriptional activator